MKSIVDKINKYPYLVFVLTVFKIWDIIKPLVKRYNMDAISKYYANYDWANFGTLIIVLIILYVTIKRGTKTDEDIKLLHGEVAKTLINHRAALDHIQKDNLIGYYALKYKITCKSEKTKEGELRYVYPNLIAISTENVSISEMKEALSKFYGYTVKEIENIIAGSTNYKKVPI
jgi:hypothetical protein